MSVKKVLIIVGVVIALGVVAGLSIWKSQSNVTKVQTQQVSRQELVSVVSGTGQIKPKTYVNIGATAFGRITHLEVKEGDHVHKGQTLATLENVQPTATVAAQQATIASTQTDVNADVAAEATAKANIDAAKADLEQRKLDFNRAQALYQDQLIAKQDYDAKKATFDSAVATLAQRVASEQQAKANTASQQAKVKQAVASQRSNYDALDKTVSRAPYDGLVTNIPVREGETMVTGIQNAEGSTLMTIADMSVITAEVKVDETDIVNLSLGQPADVTVDALPGHTFHGRVTEVGDQALLRTTGQSTTQSTTGTEEAKDFKVIVTLDGVGANNEQGLRPGLSATAKITTARRANAIVIPIQALVQRDPAVEKALFEHAGKPGGSRTSTVSAASGKSDAVQGVYVLRADHRKQRVVFVPVTTGITGATDIEVLSGVQPGDTLVTGRYRVLRSLKSGTLVKVDNSAETTTSSSDDSSSS